MNFLEAPDPSISYNLIGRLKSVQLIEVKINFYLNFYRVADLEKIRWNLYGPRVRPTAGTGLLLLKYFNTT